MWVSVGGYDREVAEADQDYPANTIVKRGAWPDESKVLGETVFNQSYAYRPPSQVRFGINPNMWGVVLRDTLGRWPGPPESPFRNIQTFQSAALHEFGHLIGLGHVPEECGSRSVMSFPMRIGQAPLQPTRFDVQGVSELKLKRQ